jgi:ABC-2 type transport system ATP-binding protein
MILVGALAPDAGSVSVAGRLGYCPQEPQVYDRLTCDEHFELFGHAYAMTRASQLAASRGLYEDSWPTTRATRSTCCSSCWCQWCSWW